MTFEEKLDKVILLLQELLSDKNKGVVCVQTNATSDISSSVVIIPKYTHSDIREIVMSKKNSGILAQDLKTTLTSFNYTAIVDVLDKDIDAVYNAFLSL